MTLGKNIRAARQTQGLRQYELAKISGISVSYLSEIENNRTTPSLRTLVKIAKALRLDISLLIKQ